MPPAMLNAYIDALPRLTAEESLLASERVAVGSGSLKRFVARRIQSGWIRQADQRRPTMRASGPAEYRAQMAAVGVALKLEKRAEPNG